MNFVIAAPFGRLLLSTEADCLTGISFVPPDTPLTGCPDNSMAVEVIRQLECYFADPAYHFDLEYRLRGTPYQQRVWAQIAAIPSGQTVRYRDIAEALGSVPRAVGGACGCNPLPVIIPCHRVVASNGLGGFNHTSGSGWLMEIKCWLLRHEGVLQQTLL